MDTAISQIASNSLVREPVHKSSISQSSIHPSLFFFPFHSGRCTCFFLLLKIKKNVCMENPEYSFHSCSEHFWSTLVFICLFCLDFYMWRPHIPTVIIGRKGSLWLPLVSHHALVLSLFVGVEVLSLTLWPIHRSSTWSWPPSLPTASSWPWSSTFPGRTRPPWQRDWWGQNVFSYTIMLFFLFKFKQSVHNYTFWCWKVTEYT